MGPDQNHALTGFRNPVDNCDAFFLQKVENLGVMNQGAVGENGLIVFFGGIQYKLNSPFYPHAESGSFCDNDFHLRKIL